MRESIKQFVKIVAESLPVSEPIFEFGSLQVPDQVGFADLRPIFPNKEYVGCDIREGPGVDRILDLHNIRFPSKSCGTVLILDTLEHVEFCRKAIKEVYRILKPNGLLVISSVMKWPIHDYPSDYWRFTPEGFKSLLRVFPQYFVDYAGDKDFPHTVVGLGYRGPTISLDQFIPAFEDWKWYYSRNNTEEKSWKWYRSRFNPEKKSWKKLIQLCAPPLLLDCYRKLKNICRVQRY